MKDGLRSEDGLDKGPSAHGVDIFAIPSDELSRRLVFKWLEVHPLELPNREWKPQVFGREGGPNDREVAKHLIQVNAMTTNRHHHTLLKVRIKTGHLSKALKNPPKVNDILFLWSNENSRIIGIERGPHGGAPTSKL